MFDFIEYRVDHQKLLLIKAVKDQEYCIIIAQSSNE